jgi:hypothetical protein
MKRLVLALVLVNDDSPVFLPLFGHDAPIQARAGGCRLRSLEQVDQLYRRQASVLDSEPKTRDGG